MATRQPLPFRPPVRRTALHLATQIFVGRGFRAFCVPSLLSGSHDIRTRRAAPFLSRRRSCEVFEFSRHTSARPAWSRANPEPARQPIRRILKPAHHVVTGTSFYYYAEDMLGSSRSLTTSTGSLCYDADFYPFGGEHQFTNSCPQNYKFAGKERDAETGNDDYDARYYSSAYGRFLSADWSAVPAPVPYANLTNPQTLNLYAMVSDNPETFADLDGHVNPSPDDPRRGPCADSGTTVCGQEQQQQSAQSSAAQGQAQNTGEGSQANLDRRAAIATTAEKHDGDTSMPYTPGRPTCNLFVQKDIAEAGAPKPEVTKADGSKGAPGAAEWAGSRVPGWRILGPSEKPQPGDVAARKENFSDATGHSGIVTAVSKSGVVTVMAAHATKIGVDMSFQPGSQQYNNHYQRYTGD